MATLTDELSGGFDWLSKCANYLKECSTARLGEAWNMVFQPGKAQILRSKLGISYVDGKDPYGDEYVGKDRLIRFPELLGREENFWLLDNFRDSRVCLRKGERLPGGSIARRNEIEINWTSALIDVEKVISAKLYLLRDQKRLGPTSIPLGHVQILFEFEAGGLITPEGPIEGFISSYDSFRNEGEEWGILPGILDTFEGVFVFSSFRDSLAKALTAFSGVELYELKLTRKQVRDLLTSSLELGTDRERVSARRYHTTRNSCTTNQVRLLNKVLSQKHRVQEWNQILGYPVSRTVDSILPVSLIEQLKRVGLIQADPYIRDGHPAIFSEYDRTRKGGSSILPRL